MVEIEQSAQTLPPLNVGGQAHRRWRSWPELVVESLVVSLAMVVVDVLAHEETHVPFAEGDDATEPLLLNRADEPLGISVEIGTLRRGDGSAGHPRPLARIIHEEADYSRKTNAPVWYKGCAHRPFATTEALA